MRCVDENFLKLIKKFSKINFYYILNLGAVRCSFEEMFRIFVCLSFSCLLFLPTSCMESSGNDNNDEIINNLTLDTVFYDQIYLDCQSSTPVDPRVLDAMYSLRDFGNSHSDHFHGYILEKKVDASRQLIADLIDSSSNEIIFTSGATESNNLAIKGVAEFLAQKGKNHIITSAIEHKCVLNSCKSLEKKGFNVTYLGVNEKGIIDLADLEKSITEKTCLVSIMTVNNEIGVIQPISEIGKICREKDVLFHTDAAQAYGKMPINVNEMNIDLMSISAHKIYGPQGIGALYVREGIELVPIFDGGGQEKGFRSGTIPVALCVGFGKASRIASEEMPEYMGKIKELTDIMYKQITTTLEEKVSINGDLNNRIPGNLNFRFTNVKKSLFFEKIKNLSISQGSACNSYSDESSHVLKAISAGGAKIINDENNFSIRIGIGKTTTIEEIITAYETIIRAAKEELNL